MRLALMVGVNSLSSLAMNARLVLVVLSIGFVGADDILPKPKTFVELYKAGVEAYLDHDWSGCVSNLENALSEWRFYQKATVQCRIGCAAEAKRHKPLMEDDIEDLQFSEEMVRRTLCLMKCTDAHWNNRVIIVEKDIEEAFLALKPYEYLQVCYYQDQDLYKAASAVYTVLSARPDDEAMRKNLKFYLDQSKILEYSSLVNYEKQSFVSLRADGVTAYEEKEYETAVKNLEKSLEQYLQAEDECRAYCEGSFDQGWFPDLAASYANHFTFCLKCKRRCPDKLSMINGEYRPDFFPKHYNYLQFAYFQLDRMVEAFGAAASYLLFYPNDESMLENKRYYETHPTYAKELFIPRAEAVKYVKRQEYEIKLLGFIEKEFVFENRTTRLKKEENKKRFLPMEIDIRRNCDTRKKFSCNNISFLQGNLRSRQVKKELYLINQRFTNLSISCKSDRVWEMRTVELSQWKKYGFRTEDELGGKSRFSADGFADLKECQILLDLSLNRGVTGDGYEGIESPHSEMEHFEGISLWRLAEMVKSNEVDASVLELFIEVCDRGRNITEHYFGEQGKFHFAFSQIACRTGIKDTINGTEWMSHRIHADNCQLQPSGECLKEEPAYTSNDYSAIIYLNDNFEGGEFIFSEDPLGEVIQDELVDRVLFGQNVDVSSASLQVQRINMESVALLREHVARLVYGLPKTQPLPREGHY